MRREGAAELRSGRFQLGPGHERGRRGRRMHGVIRVSIETWLDANSSSTSLPFLTPLRSIVSHHLRIDIPQPPITT